MNRQPTRDEAVRIAAARRLIVEAAPYYAPLVWSARVLVGEPPSVTRTLAITLPQSAMESLDTAQAALMHMAMHWLLRHHERLEHCHDRAAASLAGCIEVHNHLGTQPDAASLGLEGRLAEQFYDELQDQVGEGEDHIPVAGDSGDEDSGDELTPSEAELVRKLVASEVADHEARAPGDAPAWLTRWAGDEMRPPEVPWHLHLRAAIGEAYGLARGAADRSYAVPHRRRRSSDGILYPGHVAPRVKVGVVVDTSASMRDDDLRRALDEVAGMLRTDAELVFWSCDAEASAPVRARSLQDLQLVGGGGTDMVAGIAAALADRPTPQVIVVITDGETPWPAVRPHRKAIVVLVRDDDRCPEPPAWAETIRLRRP